MPDSAFFRFWEKMEVSDREAKNNICTSHVLSLLTITVGTAAKQVVTSHTPLILATQIFGVFCASPLHMC